MLQKMSSNLPWLDRLAVEIPGYGGYHDRGQRRAADTALRDSIARRLHAAAVALERVMGQLLDRDAAQEGDAGPVEHPDRPTHRLLTEVSALERVRAHVERVAERVRAAGAGNAPFYTADRIDPSRADTLHVFDLGLFDHAESLVRRVEGTGHNHDMLADIEADLLTIEQKLEDRAQIMRGIR